MSKKILLIEPDFKNKYPPLGLMKISTYHKKKGHEVTFYKGYSKALKEKLWDRIYISSLFTFYWSKTISTIKYYSKSVKNISDIYVGGVMATLLKGDIQKEAGVSVIEGLLNQQGKIGYSDDHIIDSLVPDYSIINDKSNSLLDYVYPTKDCYIAYATRGCIRQCKFCAVHRIEPHFSNSLSIAKQVKAIKDNFGEKKDLLLLDNNILASPDFKKIIDEIKSIGFAKDSVYVQEINGKKITVKRYVDFNQGIDARLLTKEKMKLLSEIAIRPLRIAFDRIIYKDIYSEKVRWAAEFGIQQLSNYILFNFDDTPEDFYERLKINIDLNEEFEKNDFKSRIWSFPMKYAPINGEFSKTRQYTGQNWNRKYLRGIQCILIATHGVVGPKKEFFEKAFGRDINEFKKILSMPEDYIIYRKKYEKNNKNDEWLRHIKDLSNDEHKKFWNIIKENRSVEIDGQSLTKNLKLALMHYRSLIQVKN